MKKCLIVTRDVQDWEQALNKYAFDDLDAIVTNDDSKVSELISSVEIIFGIPFLASPHIDKAINLKWFQSSFAGVDALTKEGLKRDYKLTNVKDTYGKPMAEYAFTYILGLRRQINENLKWQDEKKWNQFPYPVIESQTIGIVGTGAIGKEIAKIAKAFGMNTIGLKNSPGQVEYFDKCFDTTQKIEFLKQDLDYIISILPATPDTEDFFDSDAFEQIESKPIFMNIGRGNNVNEDDLCQALDSGLISKAILDVFKQEPLDPESALWHQKNLIITPHTSGYVGNENVFKICEDNYARYLAGGELKYQIDFDKGY